MPKVAEELITAATKAEPITLAILLFGLICLALIWLAAVIVKTGRKK